MSDPIPFKRPITWNRLRTDEAENLIHERAKDTGRVIIIGHPEERSEEREILDVDIYRILQSGMVVDPPVQVADGWEAVIRRRIRGTRDAAAATIIMRDDETLIVKIVMWIDQ
ncbi:MAG: hypothetical protein K2Q10_02870 [Rhodospirillales bacterium]|nr:hypothetical protein [Rhodospirillales bacterium]